METLWETSALIQSGGVESLNQPGVSTTVTLTSSKLPSCFTQVVVLL